jgi:nicotinamidase/pyrazinamidase
VLAPEFKTVIFTQDWHPPDHASFAVNHPGHKPFETIQMPYGPQVLWPVHCVRFTHGAEFHPLLFREENALFMRKGDNPGIDSYSAFFDNDHQTATVMHRLLEMNGIKKLTLVGLALDICVAWSAVDAAKLGYQVTVVQPACRAIDLDGSLLRARGDMLDHGVKLI